MCAEIAEGLSRAHGAHVIHRDLKPANVMLGSAGHVKILDFGLARLHSEPADPPHSGASGAGTGSGDLSASGRVLGTPSYMSPEQASGQTVDARSDLFSLGVMLYEMTSGRAPFRAETPTGILSAIVRDEPAPAAEVNPRISPLLGQIIGKCLQKDPRNRYQQADDLATDLRRLWRAIDPVTVSRLRAPVSWRAFASAGVLVALLAALAWFNVGGMADRWPGRAPSSHIESLAVLPLSNLSYDPEEEYFADGMTQALIAELSKINALRVISRTSVMQYKGTTKRLPEIARELHVDGIIEGSVLRSGARVRITVRLVEPATERSLWTGSYERDLRDILALQAAMAHVIAGETKVRFSPQEQQEFLVQRSVNPEAYQAYLKGRFFQEKRTADSVRKSLGLFEQAIEGNAGDAQAHAALADSYCLLASYGAVPPVEAYRKARSLAMRALELDETLADGHVALASVLDGEWDWVGAEREFRRAIELNPSHAHARHWYSTMLNNLGRFAEAHEQISLAADLDPLSPAVVGAVGDPYYREHRYDEAIREYRKALEIATNHAVLHYNLGLAYLAKGVYPEATSEIQNAIDLSGSQAEYVASAVLIHAVTGRSSDALRLLEDLTHTTEHGKDVPLEVAAVHAALGDRDRAFEWLERAYDQRNYWLAGIQVDPRFDSLRSDPRLEDLVRRIGLPAVVVHRN